MQNITHCVLRPQNSISSIFMTPWSWTLILDPKSEALIWIPKWKIQMAISLQQTRIQFTPCLVLGCGFRGRWIEWPLPVWPNPRWWLGRHIEKFKWWYLATDYPIHYIPSQSIGFGLAEWMMPFWIGPNSIGMW